MIPPDTLSLNPCTSCPRKCFSNRISERSGYCRTGAGFEIASICVHHGEEPVIGGEKGICNIFFTGCNLHCLYCQNHEISQPSRIIRKARQYSNLSRSKFWMTQESVIEKIEKILSTGVKSVGFVSPSHVFPQVVSLIKSIKQGPYNPVFVWNSNGYDSVDQIRQLEGLIDLYLPDFKYMDHAMSHELSDAENYPDIALVAIKEMYRQKGSVLTTDEEGQAESGLIIRHLVMPGYIDNSIHVLDTIAEEISTGVYISLMAQYFPAFKTQSHPKLGRSVYLEEYNLVKDHLFKLGFRKGYLQEMSSSGNYPPDFEQDHPFERS